MENTVLLKSTGIDGTEIRVFDFYATTEKESKSWAGEMFTLPTITGASVINQEGVEVLLLEKDGIGGHCTKRISK